MAEQCTGVDRWDAPRRGDGSGQRTGRGYNAGYVSTNVSPNLCPGLPFIRSTRGSSYEDGGDEKQTSGVDTSIFLHIFRVRASETR